MLPHFHMPSFHFRNPFRRAEPSRNGRGQGADHGEPPPYSPPSPSPGPVQAATNLGGARPDGSESFDIPAARVGRPPRRVSFAPGVHPSETTPVRSRSNSRSEPGSTAHSRSGSPPPQYSGGNSPAHPFADPPSPRSDPFPPDSPPPLYRSRPAHDERTMDRNGHPMPLGLEAGDSPEGSTVSFHLPGTGQITPLDLNGSPPASPGGPRRGSHSGSSGSLSSEALDALLDSLPPLSRFPTPPDRA
ncbi:MAG: hypothetical protein JWP91_4706 [Fibrobacteres bacterium]|nr:hypothetical protein [Fibrobacterota bacterium]